MIKMQYRIEKLTKTRKTENNKTFRHSQSPLITITNSPQSSSLRSLSNEIELKYHRLIKKKIIDKQNCDSLLAFDKEAMLNNLSLKRRDKYIYIFKTIFKNIPTINLYNPSKKDTEDLIIWLTNTSYAEPSKASFLEVLKKYMRFKGCNEFADMLKKLKFRKLGKTPQGLEHLSKIPTADYQYSSLEQELIIKLLYETAARPSEFLSITKNKIEFDKYGCKILVDGKTGERLIRISKTTELLKQYINFKQSEILFDFGLKRLCDITKEWAALNNLQFNIYPYLFRKARLTELSQFLTEQELKKFAGWVQASKMCSVYCHISNSNLDKKMVSINSKVHEEELIMQNKGEFEEFKKFLEWKKQIK